MRLSVAPYSLIRALSVDGCSPHTPTHRRRILFFHTPTHEIANVSFSVYSDKSSIEIYNFLGGERGDGFEDGGEYPYRRQRNQRSPPSRTRSKPADPACLVHFTPTRRSSQGGSGGRGHHPRFCSPHQQGGCGP